MNEPTSAFYRERAEDLATIAAEAVRSDVKQALLDAKDAFLAKAEALDAAPQQTHRVNLTPTSDSHQRQQSGELGERAATGFLADRHRDRSTFRLFQPEAAMEWIRSICPVCDAGAEMTSSSFGDGIDYRCRECGEFRISNTADTSIRSKPLSERAFIFRKAQGQASEDGVPYIDSYL